MNRKEAIQCAVDAANGEPLVEPWIADQFEHVNNASCWCSPKIIYKSEDGSEVWIHNLKQ